MRNPICHLLVLIACAALLCAQTTSPNQGQQNSSSVQQPEGVGTVLKVKTRLVVVDVVALDHKGAPVADLKAEDFSVQEEGKEQKIRVFTFQQPSSESEQPLA